MWFTVSLDPGQGVPVAGYRTVRHGELYGASTRLGDIELRLTRERHPVLVRCGRAVVDARDLDALLSRVARQAADARHDLALPPAEMSARLAFGSREWLLVIAQIRGFREAAGRPGIQSMEFYLLER